MIDLSTLTPQLQATHWGWTIALLLWFIGLSGMGFFINYWVRQKNFVYVLRTEIILVHRLIVTNIVRIIIRSMNEPVVHHAPVIRVQR